MKIVIAYEWKYKRKHWLHELLEDAGYKVCIVDMRDVDRRKKLKKWHKIIELFDYCKMAIKAQKVLEKGDVFIGWCFTTAVFASIFNKKDNIIIGLNILIQNGAGLYYQVRNLLYRKAFKNKNFKATSNTVSGINASLLILGEQFSHQFQIAHDVFEENKLPECSSDDYCFCGGASGRDWKTLFKAAELCPQIKFKVIAGSGTWDNNLSIPQNVECIFDVDEREFLACLQKSKLVILPLVSEVTSGLLVLFQSINNSKLVIASDIEAVRYYFPEELHEKYLVPLWDYKYLAETINKNYFDLSEMDAKSIFEFNRQKDMKQDYLRCIETLIYGEN